MVREGSDVTIVTYGLGIQWAESVLDAYPSISADLIDLDLRDVRCAIFRHRAVRRSSTRCVVVRRIGDCTCARWTRSLCMNEKLYALVASN